VLPAVEGVEARDAVDAEHDGLAVDDELLRPVLERGLGEAWEPLGLVVAAPRD
jgi:hypothetical protein